MFLSSLVLAAGVLIVVQSCLENKARKSNVTLQKVWEVLLPAGVYYGSPAISADGQTVYIGTSSALFGDHGTDHFFLAMAAGTGDEIWRIALGSHEVRSTPAVAPDGSIYVAIELRDPVGGAAMGDQVRHYSANGDSLWIYDINPGGLTMGVGQSAPAVGSDGTVYVAGDRLYAIRSDGVLRWTALGPTGEALRNAPVIAADGAICFAYHNIPLTALDPADGSVIWSLPLGVNDHCFASPAIGADGTMYVATNPGLLYAVSSAGQLLWTFDLASVGFMGYFRSSPAVDRNGTIYFGLNMGNPSSAFFAIRQDGTLKWVFEPGDLPDDLPPDHFDIYSSPAVGTDGVVYFGQEFGRVYGLDTTDGSIAGMAETGTGITWCSPAINPSGLLFISDMDGRLYAYQTTSAGPDTMAPWPKFRHDNGNSGRR